MPGRGAGNRCSWERGGWAGAVAAHYGTMQSALILFFFTLPWLNPFNGGPSTWVVPWLVSFSCVAIASGMDCRRFPVRSVTLALASLAAWGLLRSGWTPEALSLAGGCLLIWLGAAAASDAAGRVGWARTAALTWFAAAAISTLLAFFQYFGLGGDLAPWVNSTAAGEAFANLRQRNQFASLTAIGMAALLFWLLPGFKRWHSLAAITWLALGNALTTSRTGLLEMLLLGILACAWPGPRRARATVWAVGLLAYFIATLILPWVLEASTGVNASHLWRRVSGADGCGSRIVLWSNIVDLIAQKPWIGWGWGETDFAHYATLYPGARFCDILDNAHNLPLHLAVELGIPAAIMVVGGTVWVIARAKPWAEVDPLRQMAWAVLAVIAAHSLLEYPLWYGPFQIAFGLCLGLLWPPVGSPVAPAGTGRRRSRAGALALAAGAVATCGYAAWDYHRVSQIYLAPEDRAADYRDDPLPSIRRSWLFRAQAAFAELTITPLTRANAQWTYDTAAALLHYSPEPRVIEKLIESAVLLGRDDEALLHLARFRAAFPEAYATWSQSLAQPPAKAQPAT